jgi:choline dehydrogenase-like flavoprotein
VENLPTYLIVGSGPSGISAAMALVHGGHHVTILDVGDELDEEKEALVSRVSRQSPDEWDATDREAMSGVRSRTEDAVHSKRAYGSSYSFAPDDRGTRVEWQGKRGFHHSHARGGLSNIWGAAMLPYRSEDIADWPIGLLDLEPHYRAVMEFVPCTSSGGSLEEILPSYGANGASLERSAQARDFAVELTRSEEELKGEGILCGNSRLAIKTGCQYCSLCLSGCPYGLIYSSAHTLRDLLTTGKVTYLKRHLVESFRGEEGAVIVSGKNLDDGSLFTKRATRLFIAGGVIPTATLVLHSLGAFDKPLTLHDSQYFIYPLLKLRNTDGVETERMHTSSQLFMEIKDTAISPHGIHLQLYGYSAFLREELERTFLRVPLRSRIFRGEFLGRLLVAQGYLHSLHSGRITLRLKRDSEGVERLICQTQRDFGTVWKVLCVGWKILLQAPLIKALPLFPGLKIASPGSSNHSGGSLPMREHPGEFETDTMGRLHRFPRVHIVDASVLPTIPATTVTFSLMANAHRIATLAQALDTE